MTLARLVRHFLAQQVLQHVLARIQIGQLAVQMRELLRNQLDVVVMLDGPEAELLARELTPRPGLGERMRTRMALGTGRSERGVELFFGHQFFIRSHRENS